jgi:hypothetical protein
MPENQKTVKLYCSSSCKEVLRGQKGIGRSGGAWRSRVNWLRCIAVIDVVRTVDVCCISVTLYYREDAK